MKATAEFAYQLKDIDRIASRLLNEFPVKRIFAFYGNLGSGKTTLIKALCKAIGCRDTVVSPTFALVNEYFRCIDGNTEPVYHIDLYRIKSLSEALDIGIEEYLDERHYCFIEWPGVIEEILPDDTVRLKLEGAQDAIRNLIYL